MYIPKVVNKCRNSADEMNPFPSLSKWRNPSMKSSAVSEERPFEIAWYIGKKTSKLIRSSVWETIRHSQTLIVMKHLNRIDVIKVPGLCWWVNFLTSDSVGFWPNARRASPICDMWILLSPRLSNNWNVSRISAKRNHITRNDNSPSKCSVTIFTSLNLEKFFFFLKKLQEVFINLLKNPEILRKTINWNVWETLVKHNMIV